MARVAPSATPWPNRDAHFIMNVHTRWRDKAQDAGCVSWTRQLFDAAAPFASGSVYVNFMPDDEKDRIGQAYGTNYGRLSSRHPTRNRSTKKAENHEGRTQNFRGRACECIARALVAERTAQKPASAIAIANNKSGDPAAPAAPAGRSAPCSAGSPRGPRLARA